MYPIAQSTPVTSNQSHKITLSQVDPSTLSNLNKYHEQKLMFSNKNTSGIKSKTGSPK